MVVSNNQPYVFCGADGVLRKHNGSSWQVLLDVTGTQKYGAMTVNGSKVYLHIMNDEYVYEF